MSHAVSTKSGPLTIWLINPYGPLPDEGWRDYCFVTFGKTLAAAGHEVIWWTSGFSHHFKRQRSKDSKDIKISERFHIRLVPTPGYKKNIGFGRIWRDIVFAFRTWRYGRQQARPDLVLYYENPLTLGYAGFALAQHHGCPVVYHQMDLWPELMINAVPAPLKPLANVLLTPVYRHRRSVFNQLNGVLALAEPYLRSVTNELEDAHSTPQAIIYNGINVSDFRTAMQSQLPDAISQQMKRPGLKAVFAGSLGPSYDIANLIDVAKKLSFEGIPINIYVAGDGPLREDVQKADKLLDNFVYLGVLPPSQLPAIYAQADIGLSCYTSKSNVEMPDKFYDYTAAGLAIINSLRGEVAERIAASNSGVQYEAENRQSLYDALMDYHRKPALLFEAKRASRECGDQFDSVAQHAKLPGFLEICVENFRKSEEPSKVGNAHAS